MTTRIERRFCDSFGRSLHAIIIQNYNYYRVGEEVYFRIVLYRVSKIELKRN